MKDLFNQHRFATHLKTGEVILVVKTTWFNNSPIYDCLIPQDGVLCSATYSETELIFK